AVALYLVCPGFDVGRERACSLHMRVLDGAAPRVHEPDYIVEFMLWLPGAPWARIGGTPAHEEDRHEALRSAPAGRRQHRDAGARERPRARPAHRLSLLRAGYLILALPLHTSGGGTKVDKLRHDSVRYTIN